MWLSLFRLSFLKYYYYLCFRVFLQIISPSRMFRLGPFACIDSATHCPAASLSPTLSCPVLNLQYFPFPCPITQSHLHPPMHRPRLKALLHCHWQRAPHWKGTRRPSAGGCSLRVETVMNFPFFVMENSFLDLGDTKMFLCSDTQCVSEIANCK